MNPVFEIKLAETESELKQIVALQSANLYQNVSAELQKTDGFVTVKHDLDLLLKMNNSAQQIIAVDKEKVVGYALVMLKEFRDAVPVLIPMFDSFKTVKYSGHTIDQLNYYVMGQICVASEYRGKGVFGALYEKHKATYSPKYDLCLTTVSTRNPRSIRAHEKVGFKTLKTFKDITDEWNLISWNWK